MPTDAIRRGTAHRFALGLEHRLPARFTTAHGHDLCYGAVAELAAALGRDPAVGPVSVTDRSLHALPAGRGGAAAALMAERRRPYTDAEAARFMAVQRRLGAALPQHRAELADITALAVPLLPPGFRPRGLTTGPRNAACCRRGAERCRRATERRRRRRWVAADYADAVAARQSPAGTSGPPIRPGGVISWHMTQPSSRLRKIRVIRSLSSDVIGASSSRSEQEVHP